MADTLYLCIINMDIKLLMKVHI